ncbi:MAG: hypothetical protein ACRDQ4_25420 [Pseudonocardiaceae bacterium]
MIVANPGCVAYVDAPLRDADGQVMGHPVHRIPLEKAVPVTRA